MKLCLISDTHGQHYKVKVLPCDVLVHAGDFTMNGGESAIRSFNTWLGEQPAEHKVIIAGNHDLHFHFRPEWAKNMITNAHYLEDSGVIIDGVKFWGMPWTTPFGYGWAFNAPPELMAEKLSLIDSDTDVLITHGPPKGMFDYVVHGGHVGCRQLRDELVRIHPEIHVFGHIHEGYGSFAKDGITYYNASVVTAGYEVKNKPWVVEI